MTLRMLIQKIGVEEAAQTGVGLAAPNGFLLVFWFLMGLVMRVKLSKNCITNQVCYKK